MVGYGKSWKTGKIVLLKFFKQMKIDANDAII